MIITLEVCDITDKLIEYRTCSTPNIAKRFIEYFEKKYGCYYRWGHSYGEIEEAIAVCVLELDNHTKCVTTTSRMSYINNRRTAKTFEDIGEL